MQQEKSRYYLIDGIRGLAIVNMVVFHAMYDICIVYGRDPGWYNQVGTHIWQQFICWTFILISGFVWPFGRSKNLRRGLIINALGLVISLATLIAAPDQVIWFGILNFLGCAVLLMFPLERLSLKLPVRWALPICFLMFLLFRNVDQGYIGIAGLFQIRLPGVLYLFRPLAPLGFPDPGFFSSDYFPILPWMFLYLCGFQLNRLFMRQGPWQKLGRVKLPGLSYLGTKSLWVYMLHQPLIMLACILIFR